MKLLQKPRLSSDERVKQPASVHGMNRGGKPVDNGPNLPARTGEVVLTLSPMRTQETGVSVVIGKGRNWLIRPDQNGKRVAVLVIPQDGLLPYPSGVKQAAKGDYHFTSWNWGTPTPLCPPEVGGENASPWDGGRRRHSGPTPGCNSPDKVKVRQAGRERKLGLPVYWRKRYERSRSCVRAPKPQGSRQPRE
jgi:hypothetical protein